MAIRDLDRNLLKVFGAMIRARSVTTAADMLGMSQPAMSYALKNLRQTFGDPLFVRTAKGMEPTPLALRMSETVEVALQHIRKVTEYTETFDPDQAATEFRVFVSDAVAVQMLPKVFHRLRESAPRVKLSVLTLPWEHIPEALQSGKIALAVGSLPGLVSGYYQQRLLSDRYVCLVRSEHPEVRDSLSAKQYRAAQHALVTGIGMSHLVIEKMLEKQGLASSIVMRVPYSLAAPVLVAQSDLVATVPASVAEAFADWSNVRTLPVPIPIPNYEVRQYWHERYHTDPANKWLRALFAEVNRRPEAVASADRGAHAESRTP
jgi:DNA-binding transcriptional LysR family regulator